MAQTIQVKNRELFETMPIPRAVRIMATPTIIGQIIVLIYNMADTFFLGRVNDPYMVGAASLILPVFNICVSIAALSGVGGSSLISRLLGQGQEQEAKRVSSFCILFSLVVGALFAVSMLLFMDPLLHVLGATEDTFDYARAYALCVIAAGGIPTIMSNVLSNLVRSVGESRKAGFGVTMGGLINIALDPLFMFVLLPRGREVVGAGIATALSNAISCVYFILVIRSLGKNAPVGLVPLRQHPSRSSIGKVFSVGVPSCVTMLLFDLDYVIIDRLMAGYSDIALAAVGIVLKVERLPLNVGIGICQGMVPIVAYNYAAGNYQRMRKTARFSLLLGIVCAVVSISLYEIFAPQIMRFFIPDAATVALGTGFLRRRSLATILMFLSFFHVHLFNSYGQGRYALFLGVMRWAAFNIPMLFLLNRLMGMYGVVWSQFFADILTVALSVFVHQRYIRQHHMI